MMYDEEDMLMLSGIQHYMFCPRQWGLIHMEQLWDDNRLTVEGTLSKKWLVWTMASAYKTLFLNAY